MVIEHFSKLGTSAPCRDRCAHRPCPTRWTLSGGLRIWARSPNSVVFEPVADDLKVGDLLESGEAGPDHSRLANEVLRKLD